MKIETKFNPLAQNRIIVEGRGKNFIEAMQNMELNMSGLLKREIIGVNKLGREFKTTEIDEYYKWADIIKMPDEEVFVLIVKKYPKEFTVQLLIET